MRINLWLRVNDIPYTYTVYALYTLLHHRSSCARSAKVRRFQKLLGIRS